MQLTEAQEAVVRHENGPARVTGDFVTGKTATLRARAERLGREVGPERVLVLCRSARTAHRFGPGATTFEGLALDILGRAGRARVPLGSEEQRLLVGRLLLAEPDRWPMLARAAGDGALLQEVADAVCHYQASWLGLEELRTHADAAGEAERWEELADLTAAYRTEMEPRGAVDWAGALVQAGLALRAPDVAGAERARFDHVIVDDFEQASFAAYRLLAALVGPGGDVVVAGNLEAPVATATRGDRRWLARFARSYGATLDVRLDRRLTPEATSSVVRSLGDATEADLAADELLAARSRGEAWSSMAVIVCSWERDAGDILEELTRRGVPAGRGGGDDEAEGDDVESVTVTSVEGAAGRTWETVVVTGCVEGGLPTELRHPVLLDLDLLDGPAVPTPAERAERWEAEERRRFELVRSRATGRVVILAGDRRGAEPSRFVRDLPEL